MKQRNSKMYWLVFVGVVLTAALIVFCVFLPHNNKVKAPAANQVTNNQSVENTNINSATETPSPEDPYQKGVGEFANKNYPIATTYFSEAIQMNPQNIDAYIKKSESLYNQNDKNGSIEIIKEGLVANPNNSELKSRLDTLQIDPRSTDYSL